MGSGQSTQGSAPSRALHVLAVASSSPASQTDLEPFFDFVVGFDGDSMAAQDSVDVVELERIVEAHEGQILNILVWSSKTRDTRVVPIIPSRQWSQPGVAEPKLQPSLLGLSMRMCEPELSGDNVWHVLDVIEGSPAESAGLVPGGDWIIGWTGGILNSEGDFYDLVQAHVDKPLRVYVYSHDFDTLREVVMVPNHQWGGEGLLGCIFGFGLLHRIPPQPADRVPGATPPELEEPVEEYQEQQLFVPADVATTNAHPNPTLNMNTESTLDHGEISVTHQHTLDDTPFTPLPISAPTPRRTSTFNADSIPSPTRTPFGSSMNGTGSRVFSFPGERTPGTASPFRPAASSVFSQHPSHRTIHDDTENDTTSSYEGDGSIAGTTEESSETNSQGSLTSVD